MCKQKIYVSDVLRSLISYQNLRASEIHVSTPLKNNKEILDLRQRHRFFATTHMKDDGLYQIIIKPITISPIKPIDAEEVCLAAWT